MADVKPYWQNYINGQWVDGGAGRIGVIDPATNQTLTEHALADAQDVDRAVRAAEHVHLSGALTSMRPIERGRLVQSMGDYIKSNKTQLSELLSLEQGKPYWEALIEIEGAALYFEYYGNQSSTVEGRSIPLGDGYFDFTHYEPYGVSAQIIPWNYPIEMTARSLAAALATGNASVIKSSELTPVTSYIFAQAAEYAGLPNGAVNILCGLGSDAGVALTSHKDVNQIVFTGSVETGIAIASAAAKNVVPCVLELGGKSAAIVHSDADLDAFETDLRWGIYFNAGQVCSAMSRVIVHESRHAELIARAEKVAKSLKVAPGITLRESGEGMGMMVSHAQKDRAISMIGRAVEQGARVVTGAHGANMQGACLAPTVLDRVTPEIEIASQEVFGPVLSVLKFTNDAEAIEIANGTDYGLVAGVFTKDLDRATRAARALLAGQVFVNEWYAGGVETPFGGYGKSGYGREKGREALWNYVQTKNIAIKT